MSRTALDALRSRLTDLQTAGHLDEASVRQAFADARQHDVRVTPAQLEALYADLHQRDAGALEAAVFLRAAMPDVAAAAAAPEANGRSALAASALRLAAGADQRLQRDEIDAGLSLVAGYFVQQGADPETAARQARWLILGELGLRAGGVTQHSVDAAGDVTALASSFGDPLAVHSASYQTFLTDRAVRETRAELVAFAEKNAPELAGDLAAAASVANMAKLLADAGLLADAVQDLAHNARPPFDAAFAQLAGESPEAAAAGLAALDHIDVRITDTNADGRLDTGDVLAVQLGQAAILEAVSPDLRDRLQVARTAPTPTRSSTPSLPTCASARGSTVRRSTPSR